MGRGCGRRPHDGPQRCVVGLSGGPPFPVRSCVRRWEWHVVGPTTGVTRNRVSSFVRRGDRYFAANDTGGRTPRSLQYPICDGCAGLHEIRCACSTSRKGRVMMVSGVGLMMMVGVAVVGAQHRTEIAAGASSTRTAGARTMAKSPGSSASWNRRNEVSGMHNPPALRGGRETRPALAGT